MPLKLKKQSKPFTEAHQAVIKLSSLKSKLSPAEEETLSILIDQELMTQLKQSIQEAKEGKLEPLSSIL